MTAGGGRTEAGTFVVQIEDRTQSAGQSRGRRKLPPAPLYLQTVNEVRDSRRLRLLKLTVVGIAALVCLAGVAVKLLISAYTDNTVSSANQDRSCSSTYYTSADARMATLPCDPVLRQSDSVSRASLP